MAGWLAIGTLYDVAAGVFLLLPFALLACCGRPAGRGGHSASPTSCWPPSLCRAGLSSASEFVFWNEFSSRFNFIAVDYLIYTREVIGNIRESYPMTPILAGLGALTAVLLGLSLRSLWRAAASSSMTFARRSLAMAGYAAAAVLPSPWCRRAGRSSATSAQAQQLAGNGIWEFFHAFNTNEIDYDRFYATLPIDRAYRELRKEFTDAGPVQFTDSPTLPIERRITGAGRRSG